MKHTSFVRNLTLFSSTALLAQTASAALFSTDFNTDQTANWTVNPTATIDYIADFYYDYSTIGVPAAPNGSGTRGLKMTANNSVGILGGLSVSPTGLSLSGSYQLSFDMWQNYAGPVGPGGNGTTQFSMYGIGTTGSSAATIGSANWVSGANGVGFGTTLDGGAAADYRAYSSVAPTSYASGNAVYQSPGGTINESGAYYTSFFASQTAPAAQVGLFPGQTGATQPGETSFLWRRVVIDVDGGFATWSIDGLLLGKVNLSTVVLGGGNIFFGHDDTNAGASTEPNRTLLNVTLIDNISIVAVPEPSSLALVGLGGLALLARRRK
jgi:hypothetical protein